MISVNLWHDPTLAYRELRSISKSPLVTVDLLETYLKNEYSLDTIQLIMEKHNTELRIWKKANGQMNWPMDGEDAWQLHAPSKCMQAHKNGKNAIA